MDTGYNVNDRDIVIVNTPNNNINNIDNDRFAASRNAESIAYKLVDKFNSPTSFNFYCKVAYKLSEARIWQHYERATTAPNVKSPAGLFNWLCRRDGV